MAIVATALTVGGVMSVAAHGDPVELVIVIALGVGAVGCWRRVGAGRPVQGDERRPWGR